MASLKRLLWGAVCVVGCSYLSPAVAADEAASAVLVAHAGDAQAAVFRLPSRELKTLKVGEALGDGSTLLAVTADGVVLRLATRWQGSAAEIRLQDGQAIPGERLRALTKDAAQPQAHPLVPNVVRVPPPVGHR